MRDYLLSSKRLVLTVKKYPCLYDYDSRDYHRRKVTKEAWQRVAEETGSTVSNCRRTWKNLRIVFTRHLKRPFQDTKYYLLDDMQFLSPFIINHKCSSQISVTPPILQCRSDNANDNSENNAVDTTEDNGSTIDISDSFTSESNDELNIRSSDNSVTIKTLPVPPLRNANLAEPHEELQVETFREPILQNEKLQSPPKFIIESVQSLKLPEPDNTKKMFLLSLLPDLEVMTDHQMRQFRTRVSLLIDKILDSDTGFERRNVSPVYVMSSNNTVFQTNQNFRPVMNVSVDGSIRGGQSEGNIRTNTGFFTYGLPIQTDNQRQGTLFNFNNSQNIISGNNFK